MRRFYTWLDSKCHPWAALTDVSSRWWNFHDNLLTKLNAKKYWLPFEFRTQKNFSFTYFVPSNHQPLKSFSKNSDFAQSNKPDPNVWKSKYWNEFFLFFFLYFQLNCPFFTLLTRKFIFSIGDFPLRLHTNTIPTSVPHINFVGIVVSYSRTVTPYERDTICSSVFNGSIKSLSSGSLNFRVSHLWSRSRKDSFKSELQAMRLVKI